MRRIGMSSVEGSLTNSEENLYKEQILIPKMKDLPATRKYVRQRSDDQLNNQGSSESDRASPPLYEVELTASDEDDDGSVLELVIPMQSRYQRVPTSSPKKTKTKVVKRYFCSLMCCGRVHK